MLILNRTLVPKHSSSVDEPTVSSKNGADGPHHEVSAADYDPSMDQEQGEERLKEFARGREPKQSIQSEAAKRPENDIDDMFSLDETSTLPAPMGDSKFLSGNVSTFSAVPAVQKTNAA